MTREQRLKQHEQDLKEYFANNQDRPLVKAMTDFRKHLNKWEENREVVEKDDTWPVCSRFVSEDGTINILWGKKLHNWDGPALIPQGDRKLAEYYPNTQQKSIKKC